MTGWNQKMARMAFRRSKFRRLAWGDGDPYPYTPRATFRYQWDDWPLWEKLWHVMLLAISVQFCVLCLYTKDDSDADWAAEEAMRRMRLRRDAQELMVLEGVTFTSDTQSNPLVIGACGALGKAVVHAYLQQQTQPWRVLGVDVVDASRAATAAAATSAATAASVSPHTAAYTYACIPPDLSAAQYQAQLLRVVADDAAAAAAASCPPRLDAVVNVAGGWAGGGVGDADVAATTECMLRQSLLPSVAAAHVFARHGAPHALLVLIGAAAARAPTPSMLAYGLAKSAVHFLCQSLARDAAALPPHARVLTLLPSMLDTPGNRACMLPSATTAGDEKDASSNGNSEREALLASWTPLSVIAERIVAWSDSSSSRTADDNNDNDDAVPRSGALVLVETKNSHTTFTAV